MIESLPDEVLLHVILLTGTGPVAIGWLTSSSQLCAASALSRVSRRLRTFVLETFLASIHTADFSTSNSTAFLNAESFRLLSRCKSLGSFKLVYGTVRDEANEWIGRLLQSSLSKLVLTGTSGLGASTFQCFQLSAPTTSLTGHCAPLRYLDLSYVSTIGIDVVQLVANMNMLQTLHLVGCSEVNDECIASFARGPAAYSIVAINLAYCMVTDMGLALLTRHAPKLSVLELAEPTANLWNTGAYTSEGISYLKAEYPFLNVHFVV